MIDSSDIEKLLSRQKNEINVEENIFKLKKCVVQGK